MLKLSAYLPSVENHDDMPSPLMDGDAVPAVVAPIAEINQDVLPGDDLGDVQVVEDISSLPVEEIVELPPHLDPTPMQPLEGEVIQEELIAENLDTEAGQLLGAQIAMEGYSVLLRTAGKNMTRQSAAFMAVGMRRASRLVPGVSLGMEDESSGTQVMAMQQAKVDEKGLGSKIAEVAGKIWEWLKQKAKQLVEFIRKLRNNTEKKKADAVYLIAASQAVESGNPGKVKSLEAPSGIKVAQVLDAIHGEDVRAPKQKTVKLPAKFVPFLTRDGKLDLNLTAENEVRNKLSIQYLKDATAMVNDVTALFKGVSASTTPEEVADKMSDIIKNTLGGKAGKWELHGMTITRDESGKLSSEKSEAPGEVEVTVPSPQEIRRYLEDINKILDSESEEGVAVANAYLAAQDKMMEAGDQVDKKLSQEKLEAITREMGKVLKGNSFEDQLRDIHNHLDQTSTIAIKACDFFLSALLGKGNSISQEDFERLPSKGLMVVDQPRGPGMGSRLMAGAKEAWMKAKAFIVKLWQQFRDWISRTWERIFGDEKKVDMLLLTNEAIPDEGQAPSGEPLALPPGTGLKSVTAAKSLSGPIEPGDTPVEVVAEPVVDSGSSLPKGFIYTDALKKLKLNSGYAFEPTIEENLINWFTTSYNPAVIKMWRDVTSMANGNFDVAAFDTWGKTLTSMAANVMAGAPVGEIPGGQSLVLNEGTIAFSFAGGNGTDSEPVKALNKRQIAQILARQKRAYRGLELARASTDEQERLHERFSQVIERLINNADDATASQYTAFYTTVNRLLCNTAVRQLATTIGSRFDARTIVMDEMIAARAKRG